MNIIRGGTLNCWGRLGARCRLARLFAEPKGKPAGGPGQVPKKEFEALKIVDIPDNAIYNLTGRQQHWQIYLHKFNAVVKAINHTYSKKLAEISILPKSRVVLPIVRLRNDSDTLISLKDNKLAPCYLILWSSDGKANEIVHFVLEQKQVFALRRLKDYPLRPIYIQAGDKEYRCLLEEVTTNPSKRQVMQSTAGSPTPPSESTWWASRTNSPFRSGTR